MTPFLSRERACAAAVAFATGTLATLAVGVPTAGAHYFGSTPKNDVVSAATNYNNCSSKLTTNKLAGLMLSIPWHEVTGRNVSLTPSPMTMGRADNDADLYYNRNTSGSTRRAFWHPGIGVWQLDDAGMGSRGSFGKFDTYNAAIIVAQHISSRYCSNSSLSSVFAPWVACNGGYCATTFSQVYSPSSNTLTHLNLDSTVGRYGGSAARTCKFTGQTATFTCYYVNYNNAQGHTGWVYNINGTPPLALPYYVFRQNVNSTSYEVRVWIRADTGFGSNVGARRVYGANSRNGLSWGTINICDTTAGRGSC